MDAGYDRGSPLFFVNTAPKFGSLTNKLSQKLIDLEKKMEKMIPDGKKNVSMSSRVHNENQVRGNVVFPTIFG